MSRPTGNFATGSTCYFREWDGSSPEKIRSGSTFVTFSAGSYAAYVRTATEISTTGRFNSDTDALSGTKRYELVQQVGVSASLTDDVVIDRGTIQTTGDLSDDTIQAILAGVMGFTKVYFVFPNGIDTNTGLTPSQALKSITKANELVVANNGEGIYFNGQINQSSSNLELYPSFTGASDDRRQVRLPGGTKLIGGSRATARILTDYQASNGPAVTAVGNYAYGENFTIDFPAFDPGGTPFTTPVGQQTGTPVTGVIFRNVEVNADSDAIYHNVGGTTPTVWTYEDCILNVMYDAAVILGSNPNQRLNLIRCRFNVTGPSNNPTQNIARCVTGTQGTISLYDPVCYITTTDETITNDINAIYPRTGSGHSQRIEVYGTCSIITKVSGSYAGSEKHLRCDAGATLVLACNANYDPAKTQFDGTVIYQPATAYTQSKNNEAGVREAVGMAAANLDTQLTKLKKYFQLALRKDTAIATDNATELTELNASGGSGTGGFDNTTDSEQALRDRGDLAWITGSSGGGNTYETDENAYSENSD